MDGVDLDIETGSHKYYPDFVREMRRLMKTDPNKQYLITAAPQCPFPDRWMGPQIQGSALQDCGHEFDYLFLQFYNNYCYPGSQYFVSVVDTWLNWAQSIPNGPLIVLGLPAGPEAAGKSHYYFPPDKLAVVYKKIRDKPGVGGIMFWDCSWVQNNIVNGKDYGTYVFELMRASIVPPTLPPDATTLPSTHAPSKTTQTPISQTTTAGKSTKPQTTLPPGTVGPMNCFSDGYYPDPSDCSKFIICSGGVAYYRQCPQGLLYNRIKK